MAAEPIPAPITFLDSRDEALTEMALALDTQRSANKAMLEAVKGLDGMLADERARTAELEAQLLAYVEDVDHQLAENKRLWCEVRLAEHRYQTELDKTFFQRLFKR